MLERLITPRLSADVVALLKRRGWSTRRIAKQIGASNEYVQRVQLAKQNFEYRDIERLAKACRREPHRFVFDAIRRQKLPQELRELYDSTHSLLDSADEFQLSLRRKTTRKRSARTRAA